MTNLREKAMCQMKTRANEKFVVLVKPRWNVPPVPLDREYSDERLAVLEAERTFGNPSIYAVLVVTESMRVVTRLTRKCRCVQAQWFISDGKMDLKCQACGRVERSVSLEDFRKEREES